MKKLILSALALALALFAVPSENWAQPKLDAQIYELRTYTTHEDSLPKLHARFRDHTNHTFVKHLHEARSPCAGYLSRARP